MATIRERKPGVWEVRAFTGRDANGKPTQTSRTVRGGKRDARRVATELTTTHRAVASTKVTTGELLDLWIEQNEPAWTPFTAQNQRSRVSLVKADPIARVPLMRLTAVDVDKWHTRMARQGVGESAIRNRHLVMRAAVTQGVRWGWVTTNVVAVARLGRRKQSPRGAMTDDEVRRALAAADKLVECCELERAAAVSLRLAAVTGARRSELAALRWDDWQDDRLTIDSSLTIIRNGKPGEKTAPVLRDDPTKTANRRTVAIDRVTVEGLEHLHRRYGGLGPWILSVGERPVNPERVTAWWRRARDRAGVDKKWRLHDLRHWSATTSIARGHDIRTVANRLGHANPAMTLRVYAHAVESADGVVADTLGGVLDDMDDGVDGAGDGPSTLRNE